MFDWFVFFGYIFLGCTTALNVGVTLTRRSTTMEMDHDFDLLFAVLAGVGWPLGYPIFRLWLIMQEEAQKKKKEERERLEAEYAKMRKL